MELLNEHKRKATSDKPGDKPIDAIARLQEAAMEVVSSCEKNHLWASIETQQT